MILPYFIAILAGVLSGITESVNKSITEKQFSAFSYFFLQLSLNTLVFLIPFFIFGSVIKQPVAYFYIISSVICIFVANSSAIKAYKTEDISNITVINQLSLAIPFLTGIFFLHERISFINFLGILAILIGILVIFYERKKLKPSTGFLFALLSGLGFGLSAVFQKKASAYSDPVSLIFTFDVFLTAILLFIPQTYRHIKPIFKKYPKKIILTRFTAVASFYLIIWTYQRTNISISNTNNATAYLLSTVFIGIIFLRETKNIPKKLMGSALCTLGIILLNFF